MPDIELRLGHDMLVLSAPIDATLARTAICPYGHEGNCQDCDIHCQRGEAQMRIKEIMRYSAPRMTLRHPIMTAGYLRKKLRKS